MDGEEKSAAASSEISEVLFEDLTSAEGEGVGRGSDNGCVDIFRVQLLGGCGGSKSASEGVPSFVDNGSNGNVSFHSTSSKKVTSPARGVNPVQVTSTKTPIPRRIITRTSFVARFESALSKGISSHNVCYCSELPKVYAGTR